MHESQRARNLLSLRSAAEYADLHEDTIRRYIKTGRLTEYRMGPRTLRVDPAELDALTRVVAAKSV